LRRVATSIIAIAFVCGIPVCAAWFLLLKSERERIQASVEEQSTTPKTDRLASPPIITAPPRADTQPSASPGFDEDPIELIRGSIADASRAVDLPTPPARKPPQKRNADRTPPPPSRPATAPLSPPSLLETMFSWRTLFGQTSPQT
jgi:hypothetical protein